MLTYSETLNEQKSSDANAAKAAKTAAASLAFTKMHGLGNDFVMVTLDDLLAIPAVSNAVQAGKNPLPALTKSVCDRNFGIGADGLIVGFSLKKTPTFEESILRTIGAGYAISTKCDIGWIYTNSDGSPSAMCGNGLRCLGLWALRKELVASNRILVSTKAGVQEILVEDESKITVNMGKPILKTDLIPLSGTSEASFVQGELKSADFAFKATCVSMGNPHVIIFDAPQAHECLSEMRFSETLKDLSVKVQQHKLFPEGVNVEWCRSESRDRIDTLIYERGCGATLACASGAVATVVAGVLEGRIDRKAHVRLPGGTLLVEWAQSDENVRMSGPAVEVFSGTIDGDLISRSFESCNNSGQSISQEICC